MSTDYVFPVFVSDSRQVGRVAAALLERLLIRGKLLSQQWLRNPGAFEKLTLPIEEITRADWLQEVAETNHFYGPINLDFEWPIDHEWSLYPYVNLLRAHAEDDNFAVRFPSSSLTDPFDDVEEPTSDRNDPAEASAWTDWIAIENHVWEAVQELLFFIAGEDDDVGALYPHLGMFANDPGSPGWALMFYHRDVGEFARDFVRIWAESSTECDVADLYLPRVNLMSLKRKTRRSSADRNPDDPRYAPFISLRDLLTPEVAKSLAGSPADEIVHCLDQAAIETKARFVRHGSQGGVLMKDPLHPDYRLWPTYLRFAQLLLERRS